MIEIPELLRESTLRRDGGAEWLTSLPPLVDELLQRWTCVPTADPFDVAKVGLVVPAKSSAYGDVVLKVSFPHPWNVHEPAAYAIWQGRGAVAMWERDDSKFAMLLERIGSERPVDTGDIDGAFAIAGRLSRQLAVPAPPGLPRVSEQATGWGEAIHRAADRLPAYVVDTAAEGVRDLCFVQPDTMVHGDFHFNNLLRGVREPWQAVDPKGWVGDPASDVITLLCTTAFHLLEPDDYGPALDRWVTLFAEAAELDREHVRRWAQARAVAISQEGWEYDLPRRRREAHDRIAVLLT